MAVVQWNEAQGKIEANTHYMSGKPMNLAFDDSFSVPVDDYRVNYLEEHLGKLFPDEDIKVLGAPWDYSQSSQPDLHNKTAIGHYRVKIGDQERIVCVNLFDGDEAISLGGEVFNSYEKAGIDVAGPVVLPDGKWTKQCGDHYLHIERFVPDGVSFANSEMRLDGRQKEIGNLVGTIYKVADEALSVKTDTALCTFTDDVTMRCWKEGLETFQTDGAGYDALLEALKAKADKTEYEVGELQQLFDKAVELVKDRAPKVINSGDIRLSSTFNFIDKMLKLDPDGRVIFTSYDTVSRGYVPMVSENATHDVGFAVLRIITKPELYDGEDKAAQIQEGLQEFVDGYNDASGLQLSVQEALEAAKTVSALQMLFGVGYSKLADGHEATHEDLVDHLLTQVIPQTQRLQTLEADVL